MLILRFRINVYTIIIYHLKAYILPCKTHQLTWLYYLCIKQPQKQATKNVYFFRSAFVHKGKSGPYIKYILYIQVKLIFHYLHTNLIQTYSFQIINQTDAKLYKYTSALLRKNETALPGFVIRLWSSV